jgi:hypothetical protein
VDTRRKATISWISASRCWGNGYCGRSWPSHHFGAAHGACNEACLTKAEKSRQLRPVSCNQQSSYRRECNEIRSVVHPALYCRVETANLPSSSVEAVARFTIGAVIASQKIAGIAGRARGRRSSPVTQRNTEARRFHAQRGDSSLHCFCDLCNRRFGFGMRAQRFHIGPCVGSNDSFLFLDHDIPGVGNGASSHE